MIRELVRSMLAEGAVEVACAENGIEGLRLVKSRPFDLILLDVVLPQMDGLTLCRLIKADAQTARTPLYMLTAKQKKRGTLTVGAATATVAPGAHKHVSVGLNANGRRLLKAHPHLAVSVTVTRRVAGGRPTVLETQRLTL